MEISLPRLFCALLLTGFLLCVSSLPASTWSECSVTCGRGVQYFYNANSAINSTRSCTNDPCPINGGWSDFLPRHCVPHICNVPTTVLYLRDCDNPLPQHNGRDCDGAQAKARYRVHCPISPCEAAVVEEEEMAGTELRTELMTTEETA